MELNLTSGKDPFVILLLSDTHVNGPKDSIPDRYEEGIRRCEPDLILHCGDICTEEVIGQLRGIAPVYAVRGNRDLLTLFRLPAEIDLDISGFRIHMEHGQGNFFRYLRSKTYITFCRVFGINPDYRKVVRIRDDFGKYDLYCFGHSHVGSMEQREGTLLINPGHMDVTWRGGSLPAPSFCVIQMYRDRIVVRKTIFAGQTISTETTMFPRKHTG